ncbi:MAG: hypothetical protein ABI822_00095 [Bryobacteraceae bacterium]
MPDLRVARRYTLAACTLLVAISFLAYVPISCGYFLADDFAYVHLYAQRPFSEWLQNFTADWSRGLWGYQLDELRPMVGLAYWIDGRLWPYRSCGYHLTNIAFHAGNTVLVFFLARTALSGAFAIPFLTALLFSVLPVHSEAVSWIAGRTDVICTFFSLTSLLAFTLYRSSRKYALYIASLVLFFFAIFSKENAITFPLLPLGFDLFRRKGDQERWRSLWPGIGGFFAVLAVYLLIRKSVLLDPIRADKINGTELTQFLSRQAEYFQFLVPGPPTLVFFIAICAVLGFLWRQLRCQPPVRILSKVRMPLFFGPWWYLACVAPLAVTYVSTRHLYMASVAVCLLLSLFLRRMLRPRAFAVVAVCLVASFSTLLLRQNLRWRRVAALSGSARTQIEELTKAIPPGAGLIINIPDRVGAQHLWLASLPFALNPPFSGAGVYKNFRVVERPTSYQYWTGSPTGTGRTWIGDRLPVIAGLIAMPADCYVVSLNGSNQFIVTRIPGSEVGGRLVALLQELQSNTRPDSVFVLDRVWDSFWKREIERSLPYQ